VDDQQGKGSLRGVAGSKGQKYNVKAPKKGAMQRTASQKLYFYIDGKLHRTIRADRAQDLIRAWRYEDNRTVMFVFSDLKRSMQQAFDTSEVCRLLNRTKENIFLHLRRGAINPPYKIGVQENGFGHYKWSEDDVLALHEHYLTVGSGRPRKDGILSSATRLPTRLELVAMMKQQKMYYVMDDNGNFVPVFESPDWT
jgi:hypothetical protein